jgi:hypothetical protein
MATLYHLPRALQDQRTQKRQHQDYDYHERPKIFIAHGLVLFPPPGEFVLGSFRVLFFE